MLEIRAVHLSDLAGERLSDEVLCGEDVTVRIGRSGFSLGYTPAARAEWRVFPQDERVRLLLESQNANALFFAAAVDQQLAGVAVLYLSQTGWGDVLDLRVDAAFRRQGVGTALLTTCQQSAAKRGVSGLRAAVTDTNPVMCQFLEHHGFTVQGLDRMACALLDSERAKPLQQRACLMWFYRKQK